MKKLITVIGISLIVLAGFSSIAGATISFTLGIGNPAISGYPGPYARVDVDRTSATTAEITFVSLSNGGNYYLLGDGGSVAANVNASSFTLTGKTGTNTFLGFMPGPYSDGGAGNEDGFGSFNQTIDSFDGYQHSSTVIRFQIANNSGTWASDSDVLIANADGHRAAAHIFVTSNPPLFSGSAVATGFATEGGTPQTPEPTSMLLLGLGLAGFGAARRRKKS